MADVELVERRMPTVGARTFPLGLRYGQAITGIILAFGVFVVLLVSSGPTGVLLAVPVELVLAAAFLVPLNSSGERAIHLVPRYAAFAGRLAAGTADVHIREIEGRHVTHREPPHDFPVSAHLGERLWLSSFEWRANNVALIVEGGTRLRPWRAAYIIVLQVSGRDPFPLESADYQEQLVRRWTNLLNTLTKKDLGLTAVEELMISRQRLPGEGVHWYFDELLGEQPAVLADEHRAVQSLHDRGDTERRMYLALRSGGTLAAWFKARSYGSNRAGVEKHFCRLLDRSGGALAQAGLHLIRTLDFDRMNALLRLLVDPTYAPAVGYREAGVSPPSVPVEVAPISDWEPGRSHLLVNGRWTCTLRVTGWPAAVIGPSFLATALLNHQGNLRVSVIYGPQSRKTIGHVNKAGMTSNRAKAERRDNMGQVTTGTVEQAESEPELRDQEMARGYEPVTFDMYLTVDAPDEVSGLAAVDDLATQCDSVGVDLGVCHAWQEGSYAHTLPFCRALI